MFLCLLFLATQVLGQSKLALPKIIEDSSITISDPLATMRPRARLSHEGYLRIESMKYPTAIPDNSQLDQSLLVSTQLKVGLDSELAQHGINMAAGKYMDLGNSQFSMHELYTSGFGSGRRTQIAMGRKIEFWSQLDQDWQLGLWQPKSLFDSLRPEDSGLTGFFFKHKEADAEFIAFASPIFIPTMGPDVRQKDGGLVADSRWYRSPSATFPLFGRPTKIIYSLDIPDIAKLASNPGLGARYRMGNESHGFWVSGNAGYKPMNSLLLKYKSNLFLPEQNSQTGEVSISPDVGYHQLWGADLGYGFSRSMIALSYLEDRPTIKTPEAPYVMQNPKSMKAFSVHAQTNLDVPVFSEPVELTGNYLKLSGGSIVDNDSNGTPQGAIFDQRFNFTNAASVHAKFSTQVFGKQLKSSFKYMREFDQNGTLINGELDLYPTRSLALIVGADVLGIDNGVDENLDTRFLNQFRANDRVYGGISYVF